ncbi:hypothetical protein JHU04_001106 [Brenneria sp. 4F2]|nr:hypothetical protein [Brenneria bubanii]
MKLLKDNKKIFLSGKEAISVLIEIEYMLISLNKISRYYYHSTDKEMTAERRAMYCEETTRFIDENEITSRLAKIRKTICKKFNSELGYDDMDDIERALESITFWEKDQ